MVSPQTRRSAPRRRGLPSAGSSARRCTCAALAVAIAGWAEGARGSRRRRQTRNITTPTRAMGSPPSASSNMLRGASPAVSRQVADDDVGRRADEGGGAGQDGNVGNGHQELGRAHPRRHPRVMTTGIKRTTTGVLLMKADATPTISSTSSRANHARPRDQSITA